MKNDVDWDLFHHKSEIETVLGKIPKQQCIPGTVVHFVVE